jgi:peptide/nickel transport system substrate-binding protein
MKRPNAILLILAPLIALWAMAQGTAGGELRFCLHAEPKTLNPLLVEDEASETIRYLTGGVLIRFNRRTQALEPELATSWKVAKDARKITFSLRQGVSYSDGTVFDAEDVAYTIRALMNPELHSATGDSFRSGEGSPQVHVIDRAQVSIEFPVPVAGLERLFDQVAILSSRSPQKELAVLGPFYVGEHKPGNYLLLKRNPHYWKRDPRGQRLPYLDSVRLDIQQNRDIEALRFQRQEIQLINGLDAEYFERLSAQMPGAVQDIGPSLDTEQMWFNQVTSAPIPAYKKAWFASQEFRLAVAEGINRDDLCRIVFGGHATPAVGPVSPANHFWFNSSLKPHPYNLHGTLRRLQQAGFRLDGQKLRDREGHPVEFSILTNAGNKSREHMAAMIQQDLAQIGIRVNVVTLDFPSLIERMTRTFDYEACLLGLVNVDLDPSAQMNIWLSSASNHQWNPEQKSPATAWEAEIDHLMRTQASTDDPGKRKAAFDHVQQIAWEQAPFIYLVHKNVLTAISPAVQNATPVALRPQTYWNVESLTLAAERRASR